jgi:dTDP-4-dehydrorhamnose 3,5-epimerase-like enzyme
VNRGAFFVRVEARTDTGKERGEKAMGINHVFSEIGHGVEVVAKDIAKGAEEVLTVGGKVLKVIADVKAISPEFKSNLATLVDDAKAIAVPLAPVVASGGENIAADVAALMPVTEEVMKLVKDFMAFLPSIEAALKKVNADLMA